MNNENDWQSPDSVPLNTLVQLHIEHMYPESPDADENIFTAGIVSKRKDKMDFVITFMPIWIFEGEDIQLNKLPLDTLVGWKKIGKNNT